MQNFALHFSFHSSFIWIWYSNGQVKPKLTLWEWRGFVYASAANYNRRQVFFSLTYWDESKKGFLSLYFHQEIHPLKFKAPNLVWIKWLLGLFMWLTVSRWKLALAFRNPFGACETKHHFFIFISFVALLRHTHLFAIFYAGVVCWGRQFRHFQWNWADDSIVCSRKICGRKLLSSGKIKGFRGFTKWHFRCEESYFQTTTVKSIPQHRLKHTLCVNLCNHFATCKIDDSFDVFKQLHKWPHSNICLPNCARAKGGCWKTLHKNRF